MRSAEQAELARFRETTLPPIYHGVVRSVAEQPGRDRMRNARLFAAVTQAVDDALIAVFGARYHYDGSWRPITAIRNGDQQRRHRTRRGLDAVSSAHRCTPSTLARAASRRGRTAPFWWPRWRGPAADAAHGEFGSQRRVAQSWSSVNAFVQGVGDARVCDGAHFRFSTEVGIDMGRQIGMLAVRRFLAD